MPTVDIQLQRLDLDDPATSRAASNLDNVTFARSNGISLMSVYVDDGEPLVPTVIEAIDGLHQQLPDSAPVRVHLDLVSTTDIAHRVGLSREAVRKWANGPQTFPAPAGTVGTDVKVWPWADIVDWLHYSKHIDMHESHPSRSDVNRINSHITAPRWTPTDVSRRFRGVRADAQAAVVHVDFRAHA